MDEFKWAVGRTCDKCGKPLSETNPRDICFSCAEHGHFYRRGYTCAEYGMHERSLIYKLKYNGNSSVATTIGEIISDMMIARGITSYDVIVPVPIHRTRRLERGYNQAELIAKEVSRRLHITCRSDYLERRAKTKALRNKTPEERTDELRGVFGATEIGRKELVNLDVLLVDDIYTTGATIDAISSIIYEVGAKSVDFVSFASGADMVK